MTQEQKIRLEMTRHGKKAKEIALDTNGCMQCVPRDKIEDKIDIREPCNITVQN